MDRKEAIARVVAELWFEAASGGHPTARTVEEHLRTYLDGHFEDADRIIVADPLTAEHACLEAQAEAMAQALEVALRILRAVQLSAGLGKGQLERMEKAKAAILQYRGEKA